MEARMPTITKSKIEEIKTIKEFNEFIIAFMDLITNYYKSEVNKPIKFSEENGKPVEFKWTPTDKFPPYLYTHGGFRKDIEVTNDIKEILNRIIKNGPYLFKYENKFYIIDSFYSSYDGSTVIAGVEFKDIKEYIEI